LLSFTRKSLAFDSVGNGRDHRDDRVMRSVLRIPSNNQGKGAS